MGLRLHLPVQGVKVQYMVRELRSTSLMTKKPNMKQKQYRNKFIVVLLFSHWAVSNSFVTPWTVPTRPLCPWDFPGKNTGWNGLPFLSSGDLPDPGIEPKCLHCRWILYHWATKEACNKFDKDLKSMCVCSSLSHVWLCNSMDCSLPGYSVHGILQARTLEWVTVPFSRGFFQPRDRTQVSSIAGRFFITELSERSTPPPK